MSCLNKTTETNGGNHHKIPHMNKDKLEHENRLPVVLEVTEVVAKAHLGMNS